MKSVKPERLNREYACPECEGFLAVFGNKKNDEWVCIDCETFFTGDSWRRGLYGYSG
jgi:ribosomal protein L37AE/L43A